jgi:hypothetical protein
MQINSSRAKSALVLLIAIVASAPITASAALLSGIGYAPSEPVFLAPTIIDFDSGPVGQFASATFGNVTFNGLDGNLDVSPNYVGSYNTLGVNSLQSGQVFNPILPTKIEFVFANPVTAFAFNWGAADNIWKMQAFDSSNALIETDFIALPNSAVNNGEYFGMQNNDIKRVLLVDQKDAYPLGDHIFIDDFTSSIDSVPEPGSAGLLLIGAVFGAMRRRPASAR